MTVTRYVGKVVDKRIFLVCEDDKGTKIVVPHVELMKGLTAVAYHSGTPVAPFKFLNTLELARFMTGRRIDGKFLKTPSQLKKELDERIAKSMKDPDFASMYEEVMKLKGQKK